MLTDLNITLFDRGLPVLLTAVNGVFQRLYEIRTASKALERSEVVQKT
jgi:hypothetical protein